MRKVKFAKNGKISKNTQNATALVCVCLSVSFLNPIVCVCSHFGWEQRQRETTFLFTFWHREQALKSEYIEHLFSLGHKEDFTKKFWEYMSDSACTQAALIVHAHTNI